MGGTLPIREERGILLDQSWQGSALGAQCNRTQRGESRMCAACVYQPVSNFVSEIKQPGIYMLWILICPFRPFTGYEYREWLWVQWAGHGHTLIPCASLYQGLSRETSWSYFSQSSCPKILKKRERERDFYFHPIKTIWPCSGSWYTFSFSLSNSYLLWHLSAQVTKLGNLLITGVWPVQQQFLCFQKNLLHGSKKETKYISYGVS